MILATKTAQLQIAQSAAKSTIPADKGRSQEIDSEKKAGKKLSGVGFFLDWILSDFLLQKNKHVVFFMTARVGWGG